LGDCTAVDESILMLVSAHGFCMEVKRNPSAWVLVTTYCRKFLKWLNATDLDELSDITQGDYTDTAMQLKSFMVIDPTTSPLDKRTTHAIARKATNGDVSPDVS
jgi:hypothetical protein